MVNRLETIKNNMYTLPILDKEDTKNNKLKEAIIFCDKEGNV